MEERIIDDEDARLVKIKRTKNGDDVVEDTGAEAEAAPSDETADGSDYTVEFADDEDYDEDLVGLTPTQLKEELERRERMKQEARDACDECIARGEALLREEDFAGAEEEFASAVSFLADDESAHRLLWMARTKNHTDTETYYDSDHAYELQSAPQAVRDEVLAHDGEKLRSERESLLAEIGPLETQVKSKRAERRDPLLANKNYYRVRLCVLLLCVVCFAIASGISAYYTVRTTSIAPIITCAVFGGGAVISLIFTVFYTRFLLVALRLYLANENLSSTEDGRTLLALKKREACLALILDGEETQENGAERL